ncbi:hypothetical protein CDD83_2533 [Cordyceps sp. RAO-2017]|nr:hypothetical protein CDD83_2533 [Cordyceps sp. RAO-2017]
MVKILSPGSFRRRPSSFSRYVVLAILFLAAFYSFKYSSHELYTNPSNLRRPSSDDPLSPGDSRPDTAPPSTGPDTHGHPIDKLIYDAQHTFAELISKESKTVDEAAQAYRQRRQRHPPPGFDKWFDFARAHGALVVEDFFDQIHHDLEPFWGANPLDMRRRASQFEMTINIRNGTASAGSDWFWTQIWLKLIKKIEVFLPDMDLALNAMDEPRIVVPWENINEHVSKAARTRKLKKPKSVVSEFQSLPQPRTEELSVKTPDIEWEETKPYWVIARRGCPPDSPARKAPLRESFAEPPVISTEHARPHLYEGYVANFTMSNEICHQPDLQGLQGALIEPITTKATDVMFPMFGGSKLTINNEILLPAPMYWNEEERFTGGDDHGVPWADKSNSTVWRGVATGGKNHESNWRGFQRHRFVAMCNGTKVGLVESGQQKAENFALPDGQYNVSAQRDQRLADWINQFSDVGFTDLFCDPPNDGWCSYTDFYFEPQPGLKMVEQFSSKFLPDIDGNSFSGRYLGFLRSTSLPIKATIWREWHDSRLVPWKHFVPMDNRFSDLYGIMDYFLGYDGRNDHDAEAEKIASAGKEWAERVLRKEDMLVYVMRLLLEYARVIDDNREAMGWVDDAVRNPALAKKWQR